jgi:hypothetical protein
VRFGLFAAPPSATVQSWGFSDPAEQAKLFTSQWRKAERILLHRHVPPRHHPVCDFFLHDFFLQSI